MTHTTALIYHRLNPCSAAAALAFEAVRDEIETISEVFDLRDAGRWALRPIFAVEINTGQRFVPCFLPKM